ncbi:VOC family protein [Mammaliicoccus sciuri]|uniref:VOC family protein n=1 Tax=Mammaliicoccus sciuri TaxID=1296 RepID=UPI002DBA73C4|nr:VOC family protein [Mammaliicoccus sciuri]MEB7784233.1 VOC family protein [Mammaliicoccus sciuri]
MDKLSHVMLYVDNLDKAVNFWTDILEFIIIEESPLQDGFKSFSVAPNKNSATSISLIEKEFMKKYSPDVSLETPSLMFKENNFDALYAKLKRENLTGHDIIEMSGSRVFNFHDGQGNYFAVSD